MQEDLEKSLAELLTRGESEQVEFKTRAVAESLTKAIAAFANTSGGTIVVGVEDGGNLVGTDPLQVEGAVRRALGSLEPKPHVALLSVQRDGKSVVLLRVAKAVAGPVLSDGRAFGRVGASISALTRDQIVRLAHAATAQGVGLAQPDLALASEVGRLAAAISRLTERNERLVASDSPADGTPGSAAPERLLRLLNRFHAMAMTFSRRQRGRPPFLIVDEYDVQDLLHAALKVDFDDVRAEEWTPSFAGSSSRMDFLLKRESTVVECKLTRPGRAAREIADELLVDIGRYQAHPDCKNLVCFVYDPQGHIGNPVGLQDDFAARSTSAFGIRVVITPQP